MLWLHLTSSGAWHCRNLSLADRATMVPLLYSIIDFDSTPKTYERYDRMSARELFQKCASHVLLAL